MPVARVLRRAAAVAAVVAAAMPAGLAVGAVPGRAATGDTTAPTVTVPYFTFVSPFPGDYDQPARNTVRWSATDVSGICTTELQVSVDGGAYASVPLPSATATSVLRGHEFGTHYQYRARATDCAGNTSAYRTAQPFVPGAIDSESDGPVYYAPDWAEQVDGEDFFGTFCTLTVPGSTATFITPSWGPLQGYGNGKVRRLAWISRRGPDRGSAKVLIDGVEVATVNLSARTLTHRQVVWQKSWSTAAEHTIQIKQVSGYVDIDAFAWLS